MQMGDCRYVAEYAIARMQAARKEILDLLNDRVPIGDPLDQYDAYQIRLALDHITDGLLMDSLQCQSTLDELDRKKCLEQEPPSDVTIPSPTVDDELQKVLHCDEDIGEPYTFSSSDDSCGCRSKWISSIFDNKDGPGVPYHPEDESEDDD